MTAFDRVERHLPELFEELAGAGTPDYFDDMLRTTTQARQRPAWSTLERWLPMGVIARPLPVPHMPWRLIAVAAALAVVAAATLIYAGSQTRVPAPFGPARNGELVIGTPDGDIVAVDPATGKTVPLISGPTIDGGPYFTNDGRRFLFDRGQIAGAETSLYIADSDGSNARLVFAAGTDVGWAELSPEGDRILITPKVGGKGTVSIVNLANGASTPLDLGIDITAASWRPGHEDLVVTATVDGRTTFWLAPIAGGTKRQILASPFAINQPTLSPDGNTIAYSTWGDQGALIRLASIDRDDDRQLTTGPDENWVWQSPQFSPDGSHLLVHRFHKGEAPIVGELAVMAVAGNSTGHAFGIAGPNPQPDAMYSPDGTTILATYPTRSTSWIFDADGSDGHEVPFVAIAGSSWQRRAP